MSPPYRSRRTIEGEPTITQPSPVIDLAKRSPDEGLRSAPQQDSFRPRLSRGQHLDLEDLFKGQLEKTNEAYAISKLAGWKTAEHVSREYGLLWKTFILSNLYGPSDHFEPERSHLLAAIINKVHWAIQNNSQSIVMWGDGSPKREFTYVDDVAKFVTKSIHNFESLPEIMNLGSGADYTVEDYYRICFEVMGYKGDLESDMSKPKGVQSKLMDSSIATSLGWSSPTTIREGIRSTYHWFSGNKNGGRDD